jgi:acyl-homoserine lactone acylase PvdQ
MLRGVRNRIAGDRRIDRHCDRDPDGQAGVNERDGCRGTHARPEERSGSEERCREKPAEEVVDAEGPIVPSSGGTPRERARCGGERSEGRRPGEELRGASSAPAADELRREAKRQERSREWDESVHEATKSTASYVPFRVDSVDERHALTARRAATLCFALGVVFAATVTGASAKSPADYAAQAWNVLPPGQAGGVPPTKSSTDQIALYDGLTRLGDRVRGADLRRFFKRETLGLPPGERAVRVERPRPGVTIARDRWGVPHVRGRTAEDVAFGAGWATAADRRLVMEMLRGPGRLAALDAPGVDALALALSGRAFRPSAVTEATLASQYGLLRALGDRGRRTIRIVDAYVAGINAQFRRAGVSAARWTRNDVVAVAALIGAVFGTGGGDEVRRSEFLDLLQKKLGGEMGRQVWEDLRQRDDPEANAAVATPAGRAQFTNELGNVVVDAASFKPSGPSHAMTARLPMSNALLVGGKRSTSGKPLFVGGPQVGQFYPQILLELDLDGGGYRSRGVAFPGLSFAILLGRGIDYAWSATSAGSDLVDQYVETLCGGSDTMYLFQGECRPMTSFEAGTLEGPPGEPDRPLVFHETLHGPVQGYATVEGRRVAIAVKRSTRGRELASLSLFLDLSTNHVRSAKEFLAAAATMELTFNWLYADNRDIAQFTSGRLPVRPLSVDPGLPTKGTGEYEWLGFEPRVAHAQAINPSTGVILNWNNKPARSYTAADDQWTWGSVQRVDLLRADIQRRRKHTLASVVAAMNEAATQDLRLMRLWPVVRQVLVDGGGTPRAMAAFALLEEWYASGGSRLDANLDGKVDAAGAAVLDALWPRLANAVLAPVLDDELRAELEKLVPNEPALSSSGSGAFSGWWSYVDKDLRARLGRRVTGAYKTAFCGRGVVAACAASLWAALDQAAAGLEAAQGNDPTAWRADATLERIRFAPGTLTRTMRGANKPTFVQAVSFASHR